MSTPISEKRMADADLTPQAPLPRRSRFAVLFDIWAPKIVVLIVLFGLWAAGTWESRQRQAADRQSVADRQELHRRLTELEAVATSRADQVRKNYEGITAIRRDVAWIRRHMENK